MPSEYDNTASWILKLTQQINERLGHDLPEVYPELGRYQPDEWSAEEECAFQFFIFNLFHRVVAR
jgi:hypothetical protein